MRSLFAAVGVLAVFFAGCGWFYRLTEPRRQSDAVRRHLTSLATRRPAEISPRQWESAVAWTLNLHANSLMFVQSDSSTIRIFERRVAQKLEGNVDMTTIHWIWDEYATICPGGARYQRFRSQMVDEINGGGNDWGLNVP